MVTGQKVLDEGADDLMLEAIEIGVLKERNVAGATDAFYVAQGFYDKAFEILEFGTKRIGGHGREL